MQAQLIKTKYPTFSGLTIGRVYQVHSDSNTVDIALLNGSILLRVKVITSSSSSRTGSVNLPLPLYKDQGATKLMIDRRTDPFKEASQEESDVFAVVGFLGGSLTRPICLGFIYPDENEVLCGNEQAGNEDGTMFLWKHESNTYVRVAKASKKGESPDLEISHPSGLFIKVGEAAALTTVTNWDKDIRPFKFKNPDTDEEEPAPYVHLYHPSGTYFKIDKEGSVEVYVSKDLTSTVKGDVSETIDGSVTRTIKGDLDETVEGDSNKTTQGTLNEHVIGAWDRESDASISDTAPVINHN